MTEWHPIDTVPRDCTPVLLANFRSPCLVTGMPHVYSGRYDGEMLLECSYAATNDNGGAPTHWTEAPETPSGVLEYAPTGEIKLEIGDNPLDVVGEKLRKNRIQ